MLQVVQATVHRMQRRGSQAKLAAAETAVRDRRRALTRRPQHRDRQRRARPPRLPGCSAVGPRAGFGFVVVAPRRLVVHRRRGR
jgi:hypothetical protein